MSGQKKRQSPTPSKAQVEKWQITLADLQRHVYVHHKAGQTDTVWDAQIVALEAKIAGANLEVKTDGK